MRVADILIVDKAGCDLASECRRIPAVTGSFGGDNRQPEIRLRSQASCDAQNKYLRAVQNSI